MQEIRTMLATTLVACRVDDTTISLKSADPNQPFAPVLASIMINPTPDRIGRLMTLLKLELSNAKAGVKHFFTPISGEQSC